MCVDFQEPSIQLPSQVFASTTESEVGMLNKAAPHSGENLLIRLKHEHNGPGMERLEVKVKLNTIRLKSLVAAYLS